MAVRTCLLCEFIINPEDEHLPQGAPYHQECVGEIIERSRDERQAEESYQDYLENKYQEQ